ncbi:MAG: hypothetical protein KBD63_07845, partial [Bacteriovoracaceae bacterium]|nr:hypothetical protein [Bacteriovoracaceae bacterium]
MNNSLENTFKDLFINCISRGHIPTFLEIKEKTESIFQDPHANFSNLSHWYDDIVEMKFLWSFFENENLTEIILHTTDHIFVEEAGFLKQIESITPNQKDLMLCAEVQTLLHQKAWNFREPFQSFFFKKNASFRLTLIHPSTLCQVDLNPKFFFRRINPKAFPLSQFTTEKIKSLLLSFLGHK